MRSQQTRAPREDLEKYLDECAIIVPKLGYAGEVWEGNVNFVKQLETVQTTAANRIPRCQSTTTNTVLKAELGTYPLKTKQRHEKVGKWQYKVTCQKRGCQPHLVGGRAVWEKVAKGRAGIRIRWEVA